MGFFFQRDARGVGSYLGGGSISDGGDMLTVMAKLMKQELASDAEEEGLVPTLSGRFTSMQKVPSLSDLSDPESSLGEFLPTVSHLFAANGDYARLEITVSRLPLRFIERRCSSCSLAPLDRYSAFILLLFFHNDRALAAKVARRT